MNYFFAFRGLHGPRLYTKSRVSVTNFAWNRFVCLEREGFTEPLKHHEKSGRTILELFKGCIMSIRRKFKNLMTHPVRTNKRFRHANTIIRAWLGDRTKGYVPPPFRKSKNIYRNVDINVNYYILYGNTWRTSSLHGGYVNRLAAIEGVHKIPRNIDEYVGKIAGSFV